MPEPPDQPITPHNSATQPSQNPASRVSDRPAQVSLERWLDVLILGVIGLVVALLVMPPLLPLARPITEPWRSGGPLLIAALAVITLSIILVPLMRLGWFRWSHLRFAIFRYPPSWLAVPIALGGYAALGRRSEQFLFWLPSHEPVDFLWCVLGLAGALGLASFLGRPAALGTARPDPASSGAPAPPVGTPKEVLENLTDQPKSLLAWLQAESPITAPEQDWFAAHVMAERLATVMRHHAGDAFGLTGEFGSGKSSILNLVDHALEQAMDSKAPRLIRVRVSQWGRSDLSAAAHTLQAAVSALARRVDTLAIAGLPQAYVAALQQAKSPWWLTWLAWSSVPVDPIEQLRRLDRILIALDVHLVLYLEDIDRNDDPTALRRNYTHFQAMLDRLHACRRLTFVLSARNAVFDFSRLCEHRFNVRQPDARFVGAVAQALRYHALRWAVDQQGDLDPGRTDEQIEQLRARLPATDMRLWIPEGELRPDHSLPWEDLCRLLRRPRRLKEALRHTWRIWQELDGEVDYDVLFVAQTIRAVSPQAFGFIQDRAELLTDSELTLNDRKKQERRDAVERLRDERVTDCQADERPVLARLIRWLTGMAVDEQAWINRHGDMHRPQRPEVSEVYWQRIWEERVADNSRPHDQEVLRHIQQWYRSQRGAALPARLADTAGFADVFEQFEARPRELRPELRLTAEGILAVAAELHRQLEEQHGAKATLDVCPGALTCWRLIVKHRQQMDKPQYQTWVRHETERALQHSLRLALDIEYYWGSVEHSHIEADARRDLRKCMHDQLRNRWTADPTRIASVLAVSSSRHLWSLNHLVRRAYDTEYDPLTVADWRWLTAPLCASMEDNPAIMIPQIFALVSDSTHQHRRDEFEGPQLVTVRHVDQQLLCELLPDNQDRKRFVKHVVEIADRADEGLWADDVTDFVREMRDVLKGWLEEGVPPPQPEVPGDNDGQAS